jgi:uncharacterized protein (TIGR03435 family)
MKKPLLLMLVALFILVGNSASAEAPKSGEKAPPLKLTGLLQASGKLEQNLKTSQKKVLVLEFWATWCAPCIAAMPHLNGLSEKYKNKGVQFISITNEPQAEVNRFLKNHRIDGWVGIDRDEAMLETYGVKSIPLTVLIGSNGKVLGYPDSKDLSEEMLDKALAGKQIPQTTPVPVSNAPKADVAETAKPLYELSLKPSANKGLFNMAGPNTFEAKGMLALELIKVAFGAELKHAEVTAKLPEGKFDVVATNFGKNAPQWEWRSELQRMLQGIWGIDVHHEPKEMEVYELVATATADKRLVKARPGDMVAKQGSDNGVITGRNISIPSLAKILQELVSVPVVDATNLKGCYDYNLYYDEGKPETIRSSLEKEMGLRLRNVKRNIDVLIIAPKR